MRCHRCNDEPAAYVEFHHNVGMLFMRQMHSSEGRMCRRCASRAFWHHQIRNLVFGWWGILSFFFTWFFLVGNTARYVSARYRIGRERFEDGMRARADAPDAERRLAAFDDTVARRLRGGESPEDIATDLVDATGVPEKHARRFVAEQQELLD